MTSASRSLARAICSMHCPMCFLSRKAYLSLLLKGVCPLRSHILQILATSMMRVSISNIASCKAARTSTGTRTGLAALIAFSTSESSMPNNCIRFLTVVSSSEAFCKLEQMLRAVLQIAQRDSIKEATLAVAATISIARTALWFVATKLIEWLRRPQLHSSTVPESLSQGPSPQRAFWPWPMCWQSQPELHGEVCSAAFDLHEKQSRERTMALMVAPRRGDMQSEVLKAGNLCADLWGK